ncbi:MAG TPA: ATP-binding protein, partial [Polyangiaceae bacterium]|nr:ATP-binding protein [Polyangiaceae bacterium]
DIRLPQSQTWWSRVSRRVSAMLGARALVVALERDRQNLQEALEHQLSIQRELIDALPDLVLRLKADGTLIEVMGNAAHTLAEPLRALRGQRLSQLTAHFPAADATLRSLHGDIAAALCDRRPKHRAVVLHVGLQQAFFDWRLVPSKDDVLAVVRDVSMERRLEGRLLTADRMASVGLLAASITHEINNPLTYVLGSLEVLEQSLAAASQSEPSRAAAQQHLLAAKEGATRIRDIVRGLKSFSRPTLEQAGPVDVNAVLDAMVRLASNVLTQRARIVKQYDSVPPVQAVEGRLGQVFVNLLVNAAQALPERVGTLGEIRIRTFCAPESKVAIEIQDDGLGIAPDQLPHIFEPFFTTKAAGTGLGLFIAQRIVLDLNGRLDVESTSGEGTTVRVTLPIAEQTGQAPVVTVALADHGSHRRNVLVIDDQEAIALAIKLLLSEHDVTLSTRGEEALGLLIEREFDVVLCDVMMPEMSGAELYRQVAAARPGYERRFVFMTGGAFTESMQTFLAATAQPCLEKPFAYQQIQDAMRSLATAAG